MDRTRTDGLELALAAVQEVEASARSLEGLGIYLAHLTELLAQAEHIELQPAQEPSPLTDRLNHQLLEASREAPADGLLVTAADIGRIGTIHRRRGRWLALDFEGEVVGSYFRRSSASRAIWRSFCSFWSPSGQARS